MLTLTSMDLSKGPLFVGPRISRPGDKSFALSLTGSYQLICYLEYFARPVSQPVCMSAAHSYDDLVNIVCLNPCPQSTGHYRASGQIEKVVLADSCYIIACRSVYLKI